MMQDRTGSVAVVLAAGKGSRMKSDLPKVLFPVGGRALIHHVLDAVEEAGFRRTLVVVGHGHQQVREALAGRRVEFALQAEQHGTGHAVMMAAPLLEGETGDVVVLAGDVPLIRAATLEALQRHQREKDATVTILTALLPDASGYGRIIRDDAQQVTAIVEHKDCAPEQLAVREINSSIYAFRAPFLLEALPALRNENQQGEYYLTDTVSMAFRRGLPVEGVVVEDFLEVSGVNTVDQLAEVEAVLAERKGD